MDKIPFTDYDFWAYLSAGFFLLVVIDLIIGSGLAGRESWTVIQGLVVVSGAYVVGQLVASGSSLTLERGLVGKVLGYPRDVIFGRATAWDWLKTILPSYFHPLPAETQKAAIDKGAGTTGEALFWRAYEHARSTPAVMDRLTTFLNLYGFCRNIAFVAFVDAALLYGWHCWGNGPPSARYWAVAAVALGAGMVLRYLKFFRLYAVEMFTAYAHSK